MITGTPWTADDTRDFEVLLAGGMSLSELCVQFPDRSQKAISRKAETYRARTRAVVSRDVPAPDDSDPWYDAVERPFLGVESITHGPDSSELKGISREPIKTLAEAIAAFEVDESVWDIPSWQVKGYMGFIKTADKKIQTVQLYSVHLRMVRKVLQLAIRAEIDAMLAEIRAAVVPAPVYNTAAKSNGLMLELSIPDLHLGKLAWWRESGQSYDLKIAERLYMAAVDDLLAKVSGHGIFEVITLVVGNDMLNADNFANETRRGTPQTTDGRQPKSFWVAKRLLVNTIQTRLKPVSKKVNVVMVSGNHDTETCFYLGEVLDAWFHADDQVEVNNEPTSRKYVEWGEVLLGFVHGDKEKHDSLRHLMALEQKEAWARTTYREWHIGHKHKKSAVKWLATDEEFGVVVRTLPSLCAAEDWHAEHGYIGNTRSAEAYIWDRVTGFAGMAVYNVPPHTDSASLDLAMAA